MKTDIQSRLKEEATVLGGIFKLRNVQDVQNTQLNAQTSPSAPSHPIPCSFCCYKPTTPHKVLWQQHVELYGTRVLLNSMHLHLHAGCDVDSLLTPSVHSFYLTNMSSSVMPVSTEPVLVQGGSLINMNIKIN